MYNFKEIEEGVLQFWEKNQIYPKAKEKNKGNTKFYFLQGPPYTSGRIHIAHAWNNALKDSILRYKRMRGYDVWDRAGYDMHGLPTENKVQAKFSLKYKEDIKKFGMDKFIKECIKFSEDNAKLMDQDFWRLGIWMDYANAYYPIKNEFMAGEWWFIKQAHEKNRLYKGKKIMHWCASCETALAKHELEYETDKDKSVFLKFRVKDRENEFLVVWTTTPWTIPFNLAVMINPELEYLRAKVDDEIWIVAKGLASTFISGLLGKKLTIIEELKGSELEGIHYEHPLYLELKKQFDLIPSENLHSVILSEQYVGLDAGTGLVHCAPGCGPEDFEVGKAYNLPPFNNLNERGEFENMGLFDGWIAKTDDSKFIEYFKKKGILIESTEVEHEYAHCWRCKNPVVFRATEQWFLKIEDLIQKMLGFNENISWVPKFGKKAFDSWLSSLKDNSITRQRFWGTPVPIWECDCGEITVIGSQQELKEKAITDVPENLHKPWIDDVKIKCPACGKSTTRIPDVIDVWIDAGTASWNCLHYPQREDLLKEWFPADFILEATEQVRLWFSMLLICSTIAFDKPCFRSLYMHGMILDYQGMKMSKSLGNVISPYEIVDKYGADILRYYMCGTSAGENINFNWEDIKIKQRNLNVLWNIHSYALGLSEEAKPKLPKNCSIQTRYMISRLHSTIKNVTTLFEEYRLDETIQELENLFLELSRTYVQMVRDKVATGTPQEKGEVLYVLKETLFAALKMFVTIAPFISEKIYLNMKQAFGFEEESLTLCEWPIFETSLIDANLEREVDLANNIISAVLSSREKANVGVRWPLSQITIITPVSELKKSIPSIESLIMNQTNIKSIIVEETLSAGTTEITLNKGAVGMHFKRDAPRVIATVTDEALQTVAKAGKCNVDGFELTREHINIKETLPEGIIGTEFNGGIVYLNTQMTSNLEKEGFAREVTRRIQEMRKKEGLKKADSIELSIISDYDLSDWKEEIKTKVGAKAIYWADKKFSHKSEEKIKGKMFNLSFKTC